MPTYHEAFRRHDQVLIADIDALDRICRDIGFCYLTDEQRAYASTVASVDDVQYWGDHVLHALKGLPGLWPEDCLDDAMFLNPDAWGWPKTLDYYSLESVARNRETYVVVKDRQGVECLAVRSTDARTLLANMAEVAAKLHIYNFTTRYQFEGTFAYREEHWMRDLVRGFSICGREREGDRLVVRLQDQEGELRLVTFTRVSNVVEKEALGMVLHTITKCEADSKGHFCFRFINSDLDDAAMLKVFAECAELDVL